jgi:hypothetical protein
MFPGASQSRLDLASSFADPSDPKLYYSSGVNTPLADGKLTTFICNRLWRKQYQNLYEARESV